MKAVLGKSILLLTICVLSPVIVFAQFDQGIAAYRSGDYKTAVKKFKKAVKDYELNALNWNFLGLALERTGDLKGAQKALEKASELKPDDSSIHSNLAFVLLRRQKYADARKSAD